MPDFPVPAMLDYALRAAASVLLALLAGLLLRGYSRSVVARLGGLLAIGVAAYAICSAPGIAPLRTWWHAPLLMLAAGNAFVFWLLARALFVDALRLRIWHGFAWATFATGALIDFYLFDAGMRAGAHPLGLLLAAGRVGFALAAVAPVLASWRADLVEGRRRLRGFIVAAIASHVLVDALSGFAVPAGVPPPVLSALSAAGLLAMALLISWPLLRIGAEDLFEPVAGSGPAPRPLGREPVPFGQADAADAKLIGALQRLMTVERVQRGEGLTIGVLAVKMGLPEYRLRRLINQRLGYRNFNAFINFYRIEEAKQALADSSQADVPVLTIALDAGFQSLGPFNRAFKAETGLTPTDYRRLHLAAPASKPLKSPETSGIGEPM